MALQGDNDEDNDDGKTNNKNTGFLRVSRHPDGAPIRDFGIWLDGNRIEKLGYKGDATLVVPVEPNIDHQFQARLDWVRSKKYTFRVEPGEEYHFFLGFTRSFNVFQVVDGQHTKAKGGEHDDACCVIL